MTPLLILGIILVYFAFLMVIAQLTKGNSDNEAFFAGNKNSNWYLVAFGMIGASLSGVTFISVPGLVGTQGFAYMQMVLGYLVGYTVIALVLIPLYYKLQLVSIYTFLEKRFGFWSHKTGAGFFLLSRIVGAAFRLFLVAGVMQVFVFDYYNIPFIATVTLTVLLIWIYTFQGGIKTIVVTDTLQTLFMLLSVVFCVFFILNKMDMSLLSAWDMAKTSSLTDTFRFENFKSDKMHFVKHFFSGALIALVMTGLDQDMMQKNLTCKNTADAKKNIFTMSAALVPINFLFLFLGALLVLYAQFIGMEIPAKADHLFPAIAFHQLPPYAGVIFLLGLIAAAYSSADSALTSLTTSFCVDFLGMNETSKDENKQTRLMVHVAFSVIIIAVVWSFSKFNDQSVVSDIFKFAGYTYGPLLGLFAYGLLSKRKVIDGVVPFLCIFSVLLTFLVNKYSEGAIGYKFGFELLLINGAITFFGLLIASKREKIDVYASEDDITAI